MQRIALDTIRPLPIAKQFKFILVVIDTFTRYVELYPTKDVTANAVTDALWRHSCRFWNATGKHDGLRLAIQ